MPNREEPFRSDTPSFCFRRGKFGAIAIGNFAEKVWSAGRRLTPERTGR